MNINLVRDEKPRTRRLLTVSAMMFLFLLAAGVSGSLFYKQRQAQSREAGHLQLVVAEQAALEPSKAQLAERMTRFRQMRDKWRVWALQHKDDLKLMMHGGYAAFVALYDAAPAVPTFEQTGVTMEDITFTDKEFKAKRLIVGWSPVTKLSKNEAVKQRTAKNRKASFDSEHDFLLSESVNKGRVRTQFWASGRITEQKWADNPNGNLPNQPALMLGKYEEIEPSYDFLKE